MLMRGSSDERLARLAGRGNARAFAALYQRYHQPLYRFCLSLVRTPEDAHDALQSTFERALAALAGSDREIAVRPWLFRIAHNEAVSILRRRRPHDAPEEAELVSPHTVEQAAAERARLVELVADLQALPERQRSALLMRELSGLSLAEIAAAMSMSGGAVKQALFEARTSLHAYAEGRAMTCESVRRAISDGDRRALRARNIRAHLRSCAGCSEFQALISSREAELRALATPLAPAAAAAMLAGLLSQGSGAHAGAAASASTLGAAKSAASSLVLKGAAGIALTAAVGAGAVQLAARHSGTHHRPAATHARVGAHGAREGKAGARGAHAGGARGSTAAPGASAGAHARSQHSAAAGEGTNASSVAGVSGAALAAHSNNGVRRRAHGAPAATHRHTATRAHGTPVQAHKRAPAQHAPAQPSARSQSSSATSTQTPEERSPHALSKTPLPPLPAE
jgi:RNA polymerase sigma factor (sigma-70 family)